MTVLVWLITIALLAVSPSFRCTSDRRQFDEERYTELCGGLYQRPETWACIETGR